MWSLAGLAAVAAALLGGAGGVAFAPLAGAFTYLALLVGARSRRRTRLRRGVQAAAFVFFLALAGAPPGRQGLLVSMSPFLAAAGSLASRAILLDMWPALVVAASALLVGRAFCGWICPLGAAIDVADRLARPLVRVDRKLPVQPKYWITVATLAASAAGAGAVAGWLDPLAISARGLYGAALELAGLALRGPLGALAALPAVGRLFAPLADYVGSRFHVGIPPAAGAVALAATTLAVLLLGLVARRTWCRMLCPLGACLGLAGRLSWARRSVSEDCASCGRCSGSCPTGCISEDGRESSPGECILCLHCSDACAERGTPGQHSVRFWEPEAGGRRAASRGAPGLTRRAFASSAVAGLLLSPVLRMRPRARGLVRPPGALPGDEFLERCLRCGACASACPTGTIRASWWEGGPAGLLAPRLRPRTAPCDWNCAACGLACPSGAIRPLELEEKRLVAIGVAVIDRSRCIPWRETAEGAGAGPHEGRRGCLVCEEHCPVPGKAIVFERVGTAGPPILVPHVVEDRCNGCGVCENVCPVPGESAIRVTGYDVQLRLPRPGAGPAGAEALLPDEDELPGWRLVEGPLALSPQELERRLGVRIPPGSCRSAAGASYAMGPATVGLVVCVAADPGAASSLAAELGRAGPAERRLFAEGEVLALSWAEDQTGATAADAEAVLAAVRARSSARLRRTGAKVFPSPDAPRPPTVSQ